MPRRLGVPLAVLLVVAGLFGVGIGLGKANGFSLAELFRGRARPRRASSRCWARAGRCGSRSRTSG
ncbi:hypothetical protein ACFQY4_06420 [Catellatospora bangladeshensis]|uniref:hypothetical protein n=1 Tax=Catellatospora bangladeshensis TaxID=310355 RepID=UPI00361F2C71